MVKRYGSYSQKEEYAGLTQAIDYNLYDEIFLGKVPHHPRQPRTLLSLPKEYINLSNEVTTAELRRAKEYLYSRELSDEDIMNWKIGYCAKGYYSNRVIIPSFNTQGNLDYFVARSINDNKFKYLNPKNSKDIIFNELLIDWEEGITLVEGVFDALKAPNSIPLLGSSLREESKLFKKITQFKPKVYLALDKDAELKCLKIISALLQYNIDTYRIDLDEYDDVGEMSKDFFLIKKKEAKFIENRDYLIYRALTFN